MGVPQEAPGANSVSCRTDASKCMTSATRLRNRSGWRPSPDELRRTVATSKLLEALGRALARDPSALPPAVRSAALCLARECDDTERSTTTRTDHDGRADPSCPPLDARGKAAAKSRAIPFCPSIRLGRMG